MIRRTVLTGWVMLLRSNQSFVRLVIGLLISLAFLCLFLSARPFVRDSDDFLAISTQILLVATFIDVFSLTYLVAFEGESVAR